LIARISIASPIPRFAKFREWTKLIAITGLVQIVIQAIGFACGRWNRNWCFVARDNRRKDLAKLGDVFATGFLSLRRVFASYSLALADPVTFYLLSAHDASFILSVMLVLSLLQASGTLFEIVPKLHQDILPMQKN
jgi:hypothetical protein